MLAFADTTACVGLLRVWCVLANKVGFGLVTLVPLCRLPVRITNVNLLGQILGGFQLRNKIKAKQERGRYMYCLLFKLEQSCVKESKTTKIVPKLVIHSNIFKGYLLFLVLYGFSD